MTVREDKAVIVLTLLGEYAGGNIPFTATLINFQIQIFDVNGRALTVELWIEFRVDRLSFGWPNIKMGVDG